jgi:regulator of sigma E protease
LHAAIQREAADTTKRRERLAAVQREPVLVITILATIGVLGVLILVHELGHFMAARAFNIHVSRFSIGLGPRLMGFRWGETEFRISALPLGGYVKLTGMEEMDLVEGKDDDGPPVDPARAFANQPAGVRAVVLVAGVAMNALLAVALFAAVAMGWGRALPDAPVVGNVVEDWLPAGAEDLAGITPGTRITRVGDHAVASMGEVARAIMAAQAGSLRFELEGADAVVITVPERARDRQMLPVAIEPPHHAEPVVGQVREDGAAAAAGLMPGDRVLAVDGRPVVTWQALTRVVKENPGRALALQVSRGDAMFTATLTPEPHTVGTRTIGRLGAGMDIRQATAGPRERLGPMAATRYGVIQSWEIVALMGGFVVGLVDGRHSAREMGGPIMIARVSGATARAGLPILLIFTALLSVNLAVMNLLPIPALDGGHLALLAIEKVRGRPAGRRARAALGRVGFAAVMLIMVWAVTADILRLTGV